MVDGNLDLMCVKMTKIVIVDYGMGNLLSVYNAFNFLGVECDVTHDPRVISNASAIVLPGVGSFRLAIQSLKERGLTDAIKEAVFIKQRKILGICLGFQMLGLTSTEDGNSEGLGMIEAEVEYFFSRTFKKLKLPHIGFNRVKLPSSGDLFKGLNQESDFYFVHSYRMLPDQLGGFSAVCHYGEDFLAAYENENVFGTQFHPEKSQTNGLRLLSNFISA